MATQIANGNPLKTLTAAQLAAGITKVADSKAVDLYSYLSYDGRVGVYKLSRGAGNEPDDFEPEGNYMLNLLETKQGYVCWKDNKLIDSVNYSLFEVPPPISSMTDHGPYNPEEKREGWRLQYSLLLRDTQTNKQYRLNISSPSATRSFDTFLTAVRDEVGVHDLTAETPLVKLGSEKFMSQGKKNFKPTFELAGWVNNPVAEGATAPLAVTGPESVTNEDTVKATPATRKR